MPLLKGKSKKIVSKNISEFHKGKTFAKTKSKFGADKANKQAIAVALSQSRKSKKKPTRSQVKKSVNRSKGY